MSHPQSSSILRIKRGQPVDLPVALLHPKAMDFPVDVVKVSAGFPSPAADYEEQRLDLDAYLIRNPSSAFFFPVEGESMKRAGIFNGDILIADRIIEPRNDHIVIAFVDGERLVK